MKILCVRNSVFAIFHDEDKRFNRKELKEISNRLKDLNLSICNCFVNYEPFVTYLNVFENLTQEKFKDFLKKVYDDNHQNKIAAYYGGAKLNSLLFGLNTVEEVNNLIICENTNLTYFYPVNKKEFLIDVDKEKVFSEEELERLFQYATIDLQNLSRELNESIHSEKEMLTPIVIQYEGQKCCIGFVYSSNVVLVMLNLKLDVLKDREVFGKLLIYFHRLASHKLSSDGYNFKVNIKLENEFCLNLSNRKNYPTVVEIKREDVYNSKFEKLTVGSDFEFSYLDYDGCAVSAYDVLCSYIYYDSEEEELEDVLLSNHVGTDGDDTIGEIRTPVCELTKEGCEELIEYIREYSKEAVKYGNAENVLISFSNSHKPTGFHIHLGFGKTCDLTTKEKKTVAVNFSLLLDIVLASHLIVLNSNKRIQTNYSNFTNYETKDYGFEYRTIPSAILYKNLFVNVLEIFRKVARDYFHKNYVLIEVENFDRVSKKFYKRYLGENYKNYFTTIEELRDVVRKYELSIYLPSTNYYKVEVSNELKEHLEEYSEMVEMINTDYVKNCIVEFEVSGDEFKTIESRYTSYIPFVSDYVFYTFYIPKEVDYYDDEDYRTVISENLYKLIKKLEKNSNLTYDSEKVYRDLCRMFDYPELSESDLILA